MKDGEIPTLVPQRNPITYAAHKRQIIWQIYVPLGIFILLIIVLAVIAVLADAKGKSLWADISIIYLSVFLMLVALLILAITITSAYMLYQGLNLIPYKTLQAQALFFRLERKVRTISNQSAEPFMRLSSLKASVLAFFRAFI
jgi:hypothetical protein